MLIDVKNSEDIKKVTDNFTAEVKVPEQGIIEVNEVDIPEIEELLGYEL